MSLNNVISSYVELHFSKQVDAPSIALLLKKKLLWRNQFLLFHKYIPHIDVYLNSWITVVFLFFHPSTSFHIIDDLSFHVIDIYLNSSIVFLFFILVYHFLHILTAMLRPCSSSFLCVFIRTPPRGSHHVCDSVLSAVKMLSGPPFSSTVEGIFVLGGTEVYRVITFTIMM